ncbi:MAG: hypothetical protein J0M12_02475 [Deltaproteobacteria bacterium]|nr:hypothetical protein [Deltaproteobacteria bacterium]
MKEAAIPGYRLSRARRSTKVLITMAMLGLLLGLISSVSLTVSRTGLSPHSVLTYYRGEAEAGDALDALTSAATPRPFAELVEVTHLHILGGSMLLFLLCHLLSVCDIKDEVRSFFYVTSFVSFLTTFALPWFIIYVHPAFAYLFGPAVVVFSSSLLALCLFPLREMWGRRADRSAIWNEGRL